MILINNLKIINNLIEKRRLSRKAKASATITAEQPAEQPAEHYKAKKKK